MPKVSVIIPCYNMESFIQSCIDSVLKQSLTDIELICIDDGSADATPQILDDYHRRDKRVTVIHQVNQGVSAARNLGIHCAQGDYVAFLDPDDFYPDGDTLHLLYSKAVLNQALICGGSFSFYNNNTQEVISRFFGDYEKYSFHKEGWINYSDYQFDFGYHRFLYNRKFLLENNLLFPPYKRFQDPPFFVKAMITAKSFYAVPNIVYRYRIGVQDSPKTWPKEKLHDMLRGYHEVLLLSQQYEFAPLHTLTVRRIEERSVYIPVMLSLEQGDRVTLDLLHAINSDISISLLSQVYKSLKGLNSYTLRELRAIDHPNPQTVESVESFNQSYIARFFSKIRGGFLCCKEHGCLYTCKRAVQKICKGAKDEENWDT